MEELENKKGCVYFIKHVSLSPIKIGFSLNPSPIDRFDQFKTFAPYGAELIGFIITENSKKLESELHKKFASKKLNGEWFDISIEEAKNCIDFYSNIEDIQEMNNFQIAWAKNVKDINTVNDFYNNVFNNQFSIVKDDIFCIKTILNQKELMDMFNVSKEEIKEFVKTTKLQYKAFNINSGFIKKGYCIYTKEI